MSKQHALMCPHCKQINIHTTKPTLGAIQTCGHCTEPYKLCAIAGCELTLAADADVEQHDREFRQMMSERGLSEEFVKMMAGGGNPRVEVIRLPRDSGVGQLIANLLSGAPNRGINTYAADLLAPCDCDDPNCPGKEPLDLGQLASFLFTGKRASVAESDAPEPTSSEAAPGPSARPSVPEILRSAAATYEERNATYGDSYKRFGGFMSTLFPNGVVINSVEDWNRWGIFFHIVGKVIRYGTHIQHGGHFDSAHDLAAYGAMLQELTQQGE